MTFYKYQGTGNDFILFDNRDGSIALSAAQIKDMCDRHFGIGADGVMLLENAEGYDFKMVYYNSDGNESTMCGNGGRCLVAFAKRLGIITEIADFIAIDGPHKATTSEGNMVSLHMKNVDQIDTIVDGMILNTGSPHFVVWVPDVNTVDVVATGRAIRNRNEYQPDGINVNFVQVMPDRLLVRTYERGVEDETLSCGTGVTAAAIAASTDKVGDFATGIQTPGGNLRVSFTKVDAGAAVDVVLTGPAAFVFSGELN
jgi:diaminopimelate epimerase